MDSSNDDALDIIITNVVATFRTRCHLNLRTIALEGINVIYKPELGVRKSVKVFYFILKRFTIWTTRIMTFFFFLYRKS